MDLEQRAIFSTSVEGSIQPITYIIAARFSFSTAKAFGVKLNVLPLRIQLADGSPEQLPIQREVRFGPHHPRGLVDGGVGTAVDVAVSFQSVLCRPHHVGGFHRGPGVYKTSGQVHFMKESGGKPYIYSD